MKSLLLLAFLGMVLVAMSVNVSAQDSESKIFPFDYSMDDLDNGLRVITVPLPYPDLVAFYAVVRAGSRNEVEPGKSGFAHFFEHMMFRGTEKYPPDVYNEILKKMGADNNAYTTDDYTAYHTVIGKNDLEKLLEVEADRFQNLSYPEADFRTEAKAVLGEYNKNSANPVNKLFEVIRDKSFQKHTYKHTTMGFIADIEDMPNQFEYSKKFFDRFYRPENVVMIIAGDVSRDKVLPMVKKYWGGWKRGSYTQEIPVEPAPSGPHKVHVDWPTETLPWVVVAYRGPAWSDRDPDMAALDLAAQVAFSQSSPLYQRLVIDEQKVDSLFSYFPDRRDPGLLYVGARVKSNDDVSYVREAILETFDELRTRPVSQERLEAVKSNLKYRFALSMDSTDGVAGSLAGTVELEPTPESVNNVYRMYDRLTPADIMKYSGVYFVEKRRTIGTLGGPGYRPDAAPASEAGFETVLKPSDVPLVSIRLLFSVGAASDPEGKEGLAALTASLLSGGGTRTMSYEQIVEAMYPLATGVGSQVDKEMTVFYGTTHRDNLGAYYRLMSSMLLEPGWDEDDFRRVKEDAINFLKVNLRNNNDEELGKEALYIFTYGKDHPYGHQNTGTIDSLEKLTLDDVKEFYRKHYTRANLTVGLAGGYSDSFLQRLTRDFSKLPEGTSSAVDIPQAPPIQGQHLEIIEKDTRATAISIGMPIDVTRRDPDWAALWLARSFLGEHRSSNALLFQEIREIRGLNYGDYAYVEYFPRGMFQFKPDPNLGRQRQIFQIWIRPVEPANGHFALRIALYELKKLLEEGISEEDFVATREFLDKYVSVLVDTQDRQLGYALDSDYYGTGEFAPWVRQELAKLTRDDVNRAIRRHWSWQNVKIVIVTKEAEALLEAILGNAPSPITYNAPKPDSVLDEDKVIVSFPLAIEPGNARIVKIEEVFKD